MGDTDQVRHIVGRNSHAEGTETVFPGTAHPITCDGTNARTNLNGALEQWKKTSSREREVKRGTPHTGKRLDLNIA